MPNQVQVDFVGNNKPLYATADAAPAKLAQSGDAAGRAFANAYSNQTAAAFARQDALERDRAYKNSVAKLAAYRKDKENELFIEQQTADKIARIRGAGSQRANAAGRLNLARQGADVFTQLGSGQGLGIIAIQQGPQILDAAAQSGFKLRDALDASGKSAAFLVSVGGLGGLAAILSVAAATAGAVYLITKDIAAAEAQKLKFIENGVVASNKELLARKAIVQEYSALLKQQEASARFDAQKQEFQKGIGNADAETQKAAIARLREQLRYKELEGGVVRDANGNVQPFTQGGSVDPVRRAAALQEAAEIQKLLNQAENSGLDRVRKEFNERRDFEGQLKQIEKEGQQKRLEDAQKRIEKAKELNKVTSEFFQSINQRTNADNPFFKILSDAQQLEKQILKLNPAFQALARSQASLSVANSLFGAKIDNVLGVSDLKSQAAFFRNGQKGESSDDFLKRLVSDAQERARDRRNAIALSNIAAKRNGVDTLTGLFSGPGVLNGVNTQDLALGLSQGTGEDPFQNLARQLSINVARRAGIDFANEAAKAGTGVNLSGINVADLAIGAFQNAQQRQSSEETAQQRLDRQFRELDKLTAANDPQRQAIDRRIASLSQGIDPTTLRQDTRNRIADSIERNAEALARQQGDATKALQENTAILNKLNANLERQIGVIQGGGNQNSLEVTVKPSAGIDIGVTPIPASPNQAQTNELYASDGLGFAGG